MCIFEVLTPLASILILVGEILGLIVALTHKEGLLRADKIIGVVAILVSTIFYWVEIALFLAGLHYFLVSNFICWLLCLSCSIAMIVAHNQIVKPKITVNA